MTITPAEIAACADAMARARALARPTISGYRVGVTALGASGTIHLGCNVEIAGEHLNHTVHGEQCALANAWAHGETALRAIFLSAAPCGHCRQFLHEMACASDLQVFDLSRDSTPASLDSLLPHAFGPKDLGVESAFMAAPYPHRPGLTSDNPAMAVLEAARASYAPYTGTRSGVCLRWADDRIVTGATIENAAYNPTLGPAHMALALAVVNGLDPAAVTECWIAEEAIGASFVPSTEAAIAAIAPGVTVERIRITKQGLRRRDAAF